ncbi:MAG TPA: diacylglycerol kinase family protein [Clostridiales bacterium]|nr:diacylglycerol kinase family protein [Clostridiales bacterium]
MVEKSKYDIIGASHALNGICLALKTEKNLKIDLVIAVAVLAAAYLLSVSKTELFLLIIAIGIVISAELFNTAIEKVVDLVCIDILKNQLQRDEYNAFAKAAKDIAAGAVLVTAIMAAAIGLIIFIPKIYILF